MRLLFLFFMVIPLASGAQGTGIYQHLPIGNYAVGFKIITIIDDSRIDRPAFNYLGEKNEGDRRRKITIHLWYPAKPNTGGRRLSYGDYCAIHLLGSTRETLDEKRKAAQLLSSRTSVENWFGKTTDDAWSSLTGLPMLAKTEAESLSATFPLLIGMLRPLSTTITNELLASHGYVVAMIKSNSPGSFSQAALSDIPDMRFALSYLSKTLHISTEVGSFGFSGSGFAQVLFTMSDFRVKALADIESGLYMEGLFQALSLSNYYDPAKLRVPFLHIFSHDLSLQEKYIDDLTSKTKYSKRYRLILNQPKLHHWDFAAEGYTACLFLNNRGAAETRIRQSFEMASIALLDFFNQELKRDSVFHKLLKDKLVMGGIPPETWEISSYTPLKPAPDRDDLEFMIGKIGPARAIQITTEALKTDTSSNIMQWFVLNGLGYSLLNEGNDQGAIGVFKLNISLHPDDPNLFDSLAEAYERSGDTEEMKKNSALVMDLLNKKSGLTDSEKGLKTNAERRLAGNH